MEALPAPIDMDVHLFLGPSKPTAQTTAKKPKKYCFGLCEEIPKEEKEKSSSCDWGKTCDELGKGGNACAVM